VGGERRPGIVHRLDKETSGLIVVAKHDQALRHLQAQFKARDVRKKYLALTEGVPAPPDGEIDAPIGRDPRQRKRMAVIRPGTSATARAAQTSYETVTAYDNYALVACYPHTGRTHQIRVHLRHIGHPLVGDTVYGRRKQALPLRRHFLHAAELTLRRPGDDAEMTWTSPLPPDLQRVLDLLAD
jgi:23S rRNA pseudouridine1911/1915/1917 synthase